MKLSSFFGFTIIFLQASSASSNVERLDARTIVQQSFPGEPWRNYNSSQFAKCHEWLKRRKKEGVALVRLYRESGLRPIFFKFFSRTKHENYQWNRPWRQWVGALKKMHNLCPKKLASVGKQRLLAALIMKLKFSGTVKLLSSTMGDDVDRWFPRNKPWNDTVSALYGVFINKSFSRAKSLLINTLYWSHRRSLEQLIVKFDTLDVYMQEFDYCFFKVQLFGTPYACHPNVNILTHFTIKQIQDLQYRFKNDGLKMTKFIEHLWAMISSDQILTALKQLSLDQLIDLLFERLGLLAIKLGFDKALVLAVFEQARSDADSVTAFVDALPKGKSISEKSLFEQFMSRAFGMIYRRNEFIVNLCLRQDKYCNPYKVSTKSLTRLQDSINLVAVSTDNLDKIKDQHLRDFLKRQPLLTSMAFSKEAVEECHLVFAPKVPVGKALVELSLKHCHHALSDCFQYHWYPKIISTIVPSELLGNLIERKGYCATDILQIPPLTVEDSNGWKLLFKLEG